MFRLLIVSLVLSSPVYAGEDSIVHKKDSVLYKEDCAIHKIYCAIKTIKPSVKSSFAFQLSNYIAKYASLHGTNPLRTVAIIAQESMFRNINTAIDIGLYQINIATATEYKIDITRLQEDLEYATEQHILLLKRKKGYCSALGLEDWTCYHSKTPVHREAYKLAVDRHYKKIVNFQ